MISICIPHLPYSKEINGILSDAIQKYQILTVSEYEICLVINGEECYPLPDFKGLLGSPIKVKKFKEPLGVSAAWNECLKMAEGDIVAFMNNDILVKENWDVPLVNALEDANSGIVTPVIHRKESNGNFAIIADNCQGCAIVMRRETLNVLEFFPPDSRVAPCFGFDTRFSPAYYEDTDLFLRVNLCGWTRRVIWDSAVIHHHGATTHKFFDDYQTVSDNSLRKFDEKWGHLGVDDNENKKARGMWQ